MKTRNVDKPAAAKKTPPVKKSSGKTAPEPVAGSATPKTAETKRSLAMTAKQAKNNEATASPPDTVSEPKPEKSAVEETKPSTDATQNPSEVKAAPRTKKVVRKVVKVVKKTAGKSMTPTTPKVVSAQTTETEEDVKDNVDESTKEEAGNIKFFGNTTRQEEPATENVEKSTKNETITMQVEKSMVEGAINLGTKRNNVVEEDKKEEDPPDESESTVKNNGGDADKENAAMELDLPSNDTAKSRLLEQPSRALEREEAKTEVEEVDTKSTNEKEGPRTEEVCVGGNTKEQLLREDAQPVQCDYVGEEGFEEYADRVDFEDHIDDDFVEDDPEEPAAEAETLEEEHRELTALAMERKMKKEYEIFVGGLDRDATEEDLKCVFEKIGEVVEVRLHMNLSTNKNKGYAFVKFANKEHAKRALSEMTNPVICGKRCGTAPSEDNDTLFLGNICNTWTKEAIRQKLKDYGIEGVENITLVPDVQHEGRSRGFAFLEFSCHVDAMSAYKRLQKPDVVFGHPERTAKVAFAEPIREPAPEIMAQVKTIFLDGLPPHWDEDRVKENLKGYGETVRVVLARNMSTAKRKDFGFVDFSTHEAALACIEGINKTEFSDGMSKIRVKARLSNPLPKTQAVKGAMCGGFRIGRTGSGNFTRFGRNFERGGHHFNWSYSQRGRGPYQHERGPSYRMSPNEHYFSDRYGGFHGRSIMGRGGGRRGPLRGGYHPAGRDFASTGPSRSHFRQWHDAPDRGYGDHVSSRRRPFPPEETYDRPFAGRHFDDPYYYDDGSHGLKRPFYMTDHDPDYIEPSRARPRLDYADPAVSYRGARHRGTYGPSGDPYSHDYYDPDYGEYSSYYGSDRAYGGGFFY